MKHLTAKQKLYMLAIQSMSYQCQDSQPWLVMWRASDVSYAVMEKNSATTYRTLNQLYELGLLSKITIDGSNYYHLTDVSRKDMNGYMSAAIAFPAMRNDVSEEEIPF